MKFYTKQGIKDVYVPIAGAFKFFHPADAAKPCKDPHIVPMKFYNKYKDSPKGMIVTNFYGSQEPLIYMLDPKLLNDYFLKEVENYSRIGYLKSHFDYNFFLKGGQEALNEKAIFSEFFRHENVIQMMPKNQKIFADRCREILKEWGPESDRTEWKTVDLADFLHKCFDDVVHITLLGEYEPDKVEKINGMTFSHAVENFLANAFEMLKQPLYALTWQMSAKLGLTKQARDTKRIHKGLVEGTKKNY